MDLNQISAFVRVVEAGSFTRAAAALRQPKSRVSRRIAALERELGVSLLYRTTRQFSLTEAGRQLYRDCGRRVYELEAAAQGVREASGEVAGILRVTAAEDLGSVLLGPVLTELSARHPALSVQLLLTDQVVDLVKEGVDVAIRIGELEDTSLRARLLGRIAFIAVASPRYLKSAPRIETPAQLERHPALVFGLSETAAHWSLRSTTGSLRSTHSSLRSTTGSLRSTHSSLRSTHSSLRSTKGAAETVRVRARFSATGPRVLLELALAGQGIALLPEFLCAEALAAGRLRRVLPGRATRPMPVHFVWPEQRAASPKLRAFLDLAARRLTKYFGG